MKLLRVLQTIQNLFSAQDNESSGNQYDASAVGELSKIFEGILLDSLWEQLGLCLRTVSALEGVRNSEQTEDLDDEELGDNLSGKKKVRNNVAGLMTRFLPIVEAFFVVHSASPPSPHCDDNSTSRGSDDMKTHTHENHSLHDPAAHSNKRLIEFVSSNKVLLNAILRNNQGLLDKGLRSMVQVPQCRNFLDFDVKRLWFKSQVKRLRQQANRRYGSLKLNIRRQNVFEDAYHQLRLRNADEMRGKLHVSFRHEEGVDAGGLSREFFSILAKEMFNPNYALFTSTEDGCTFQPNMHSSINPDHLSYFRFVGRIVGKAILDGYLLDAHFTRSLYKHMLGLKVRYI
jgi:E3 ubiquitin-protein ligase HUWE1